MLAPGVAKKVTIHLNEDTSSGRDFLYSEIMSFLYQRGVAGATVIHPQAGFGSHHHLHSTEDGWTAGEHMPVRIEFIDTKETVDSLLPALFEIVTDGLIEAQDTTILKTVAGKEQP